MQRVSSLDVFTQQWLRGCSAPGGALGWLLLLTALITASLKGSPGAQGLGL